MVENRPQTRMNLEKNNVKKASNTTRAGKGAECRMSGYNEIGAMNFAEGFLLAGGQADILRKIIVKEYDLDEATANWHIEQAQQWAVRARKTLNCANGEK